eukprot:403377140
MKIISTLFAFYGILYLALSHSTLLTCRYGQQQKSTLVQQQQDNGRIIEVGFSYREIDQKFLQKCPNRLPIFIFSLSDYVIDKYLPLAGIIAKYTNDFVKELHSMHDFIILSGLLLTISENLVFYYYVIMTPIWIFMAGMRLLFNFALLLIIVLIIMAFIHEDAIEKQHESLNEGIEHSIKNMGHFIYDTVMNLNNTYHSVNQIYDKMGAAGINQQKIGEFINHAKDSF